MWERHELIVFSHMHECTYTYNNPICSEDVDHCKHGIHYSGWKETVISAYALMHVTEHNKFMLFPHPEEDSYLPCMQWPTP
jgi:hypothetical protein